LGKFATISVPVEVKKSLKKMKGNKTWGTFLLEKCSEYEYFRGKKAFKELRQLLSQEDLNNIRKSSKEFREKFALR
jgi:hypothetical protein